MILLNLTGRNLGYCGSAEGGIWGLAAEEAVGIPQPYDRVVPLDLRERVSRIFDKREWIKESDRETILQYRRNLYSLLMSEYSDVLAADSLHVLLPTEAEYAIVAFLVFQSLRADIGYRFLGLWSGPLAIPHRELSDLMGSRGYYQLSQPLTADELKL